MLDDSIKQTNEYDSRWSTRQEYLSSLYHIDLSSNNIIGYGGIPLFSNGTNIYIDPTDAHTLIIGATGSKKTRLLGMPALKMYAYAGESFIATDPKAELYEKTYPLLKAKDYEIIVINLRDPLSGNSWNPLQLPYLLYKNEQQDRAYEMINDLSNNIMKSTVDPKDPYWENSAADFLFGLILVLFECAKEEEINFYNLFFLRSQAMKYVYKENDEFKQLGIPFIREHFFDIIDKSSLVYSSLAGTINVSEVTQRCIVSTFDQHMRPFISQKDLIQMLSKSDFNFDTFCKKKTALFLIMPDEKTTYHKLISIFIKQCYEQLIYEAQKLNNKSIPFRVNFLLDEFSSLPKINDFPAMITASRSRNIRFNLIIQSEHQLKARYGYESETIKCNCSNLIFLTSRELNLLNEISELAGKKGDKSPLISVSKLQRLNKERGEALVFHDRLYPYVTTLADIDSYIDSSYFLGNVEFPKNEQLEVSKFDFEKFCTEKSERYLSSLFSNQDLSDIDSIFFEENDRDGKDRNDEFKTLFDDF
nr:type IV secretory system conjugative DNA transfer family protein [Parabacteroides goldsteinii]